MKNGRDTQNIKSTVTQMSKFSKKWDRQIYKLFWDHYFKDPCGFAYKKEEKIGVKEIIKK